MFVAVTGEMGLLCFATSVDPDLVCAVRHSINETPAMLTKEYILLSCHMSVLFDMELLCSQIPQAPFLRQSQISLIGDYDVLSRFKVARIMDNSPEAILDFMEKEDWNAVMIGIQQATVLQLNTLMFLTDPEDGYNTTYTLVAKAVEYRKYDIVKLLAGKGADMNEMCRKGLDLDRMFTPLALAMQYDDESMCKLLLEHGAYIGLPSTMFEDETTEFSPLQYVLMTGKSVLLRLFLERGGQSLATEALLEYRRLLELGEIRTHTAEDVQSVINFYRKYNSNNKTTSVYRMLENGQFESAIEIIKTLEYEDINRRLLINDCVGGTVSSKSRSGVKWTLLTYAVKQNRMDVADSLIERGADVKLLGNNLDFLVFSPFTLAVQANNFEMCKLLLSNGANPKYPCILPDGESVIGRVLESGNAALLKLIFSHGMPSDCGIENVLLEKSDLTISLDMLKALFTNNKPSVRFWWVLVRQATCDQTRNTPRATRAKQVIEIVLRFIPRLYGEFIDVVYDHPCRLFVACEWLWGRVGTVPSLKHISRYAVRRSCDPCTTQSIGQLGLPGELLTYIAEL